MANAKQAGGLGLGGGLVYRGTAVPVLEKPYLFCTWSRGRPDNLDGFLLSFGQDRAGEAYVLTAAEVGPTGTTDRAYRIAASGQDTATGPESALPERPVLEANYPSPVNPATTIRYHVATAGSVRLVVYDLLGRTVRTLVDAPPGPGAYAVTWDGSVTRSMALTT